MRAPRAVLCLRLDNSSTKCYIVGNGQVRLERVRVFKTAWFSKAARKAGIGDGQLCEAIRQVMLGQADDLGGGVFKKRLNKNMYRSVILAKGGRLWMYAYLFAKQDRDNIDDDELADFRRLAKSYEALTDQQIARLVKDGDLTEICHDDEAQV